VISPAAPLDAEEASVGETVVPEELSAADMAESPALAAEPYLEAQMVLESMLEYSRRLTDLEAAVREFSRRDASGRAAINALHAEIGSYRDDFLVRAQVPMLRALIGLLDDIDDLATKNQPVTERDLTFFGDQVVEVLESYGAERIPEEPEFVDGAFQKVVHAYSTDVPEQDRRVVSIVRSGWRAHGRVLRPQNVHAYRLAGAKDKLAGPASGPRAPLSLETPMDLAGDGGVAPALPVGAGTSTGTQGVPSSLSPEATRDDDVARFHPADEEESPNA